MGKKTITLLVGVLAAVLLSAPALAFPRKEKKLSTQTSITLKKPVSDNARVQKMKMLMERKKNVLPESTMAILKSSTEKKVANFFKLKDTNLFNGKLKAPRFAEEEESGLVTPPEDLVTAKCDIVGFEITYDDDDNEIPEPYSTTGKIGFDANTVYIKGLFNALPTAWVKGTLEGNTVTIPMYQYVGTYYYGYYDIFAIGVGEDIEDIVLTYDAEANTLTLQNEIWAIAFYGEEYAGILHDLKDIVITIAEFGAEEVAETGAPISELPYYNSFDSDEEAAAFGIIDANEDGSSWTPYSGEVYLPWGDIDNDDWLISPAIYLEAGKSYQFSVETHCEMAEYPEEFEVKMGTEAKVSALTIEVIPATLIDWEDYTAVEANVNVTESGYYHFGIHGITNAYDAYYLSIDNFAVEAALEPTSPVAPAVSVVADPDGLKKATILVTAPTATVAGYDMPKVPMLKVMRNGKVIATYEDLNPGAYRTFVDFVDESGEMTYTAQAYDYYGNAGKRSEKVKVYVGADDPDAPENLKANAYNNTITFSWSPVTKGAHGGGVNTKDIVYQVWTGEAFSFFGEIYIFPDELLGETTDTNITVAYDTESGELRQEYFCVVPVIGEDEGYQSDILVTLGEPYEMPLEEHFADPDYGLENLWNYDWSENASVGLYEMGTDEDGIALAAMGYEDDWAWFSLDRVAVSGENPTLLLDVIAGNMTPNTLVKVDVETPTGKTHNVGALVPSEGGNVMKCSLKGYDVYPFVKVKISFIFNDQDIVLIDNVRIVDLYQNNLTAKLDVQKSVKAGQSAPVVVAVQNTGEKAVNSYKVLVKAEGYEEPLLEDEVNEVLPAFNTTAYVTDFETSIFDDAKDVKITAEVIFDDDEVSADNVAESTITILQSKATQPQNVKAERKSDGIVMTWETADVAMEEITDTFEGLENGVYDELGAWKGVNNNGATKGGLFSDYEFPFDGKAYGFAVINPAEVGLAEVWAAPSGDLNENILVSGYNVEGQDYPDNDDYLISPLLSGEAQTIKFFARAFSVQYGITTFEVLYSTTDQELNSFKVIEGSSTTLSDTEWHEVTVALPAGAKYFAIHNNTDGDGALLFGVAEVTYQRIGESPVKFNIYVDGEDGVYDDTTAKTYTVKSTAPAWVAVSAVYANDESKPVVVQLGKANQEITAIEMITGNNKLVDVYSLDGKLVRQQTNSLKGLKGAYIINGTKVIVK